MEPVRRRALFAGLINLGFGFLLTSSGCGGAPGDTLPTPLPSPTPDVSPIVLPEGSVASVRLLARQSVAVGESRLLRIAARDGADNPVALPPGAAVFEVVSGQKFVSIEADGQASGVAVGEAAVRVLVGGVASAPQTVTVSATRAAATPTRQQPGNAPVGGAPVIPEVEVRVQFPAFDAANPIRSVLVTLVEAGVGGNDVTQIVDRTSDAAYVVVVRLAQVVAGERAGGYSPGCG